MSALRFCVISCDGRDETCGEESAPMWTMKEARRVAKEQGFVRRNGLDLCPQCAEMEEP